MYQIFTIEIGYILCNLITSENWNLKQKRCILFVYNPLQNKKNASSTWGITTDLSAEVTSEGQNKGYRQ